MGKRKFKIFCNVCKKYNTAYVFGCFNDEWSASTIDIDLEEDDLKGDVIVLKKKDWGDFKKKLEELKCCFCEKGCFGIEEVK